MSKGNTWIALLVLLLLLNWNEMRDSEFSCIQCNKIKQTMFESWLISENRKISAYFPSFDPFHSYFVFNWNSSSLVNRKHQMMKKILGIQSDIVWSMILKDKTSLYMLCLIFKVHLFHTIKQFFLHPVKLCDWKLYL